MPTLTLDYEQWLSNRSALTYRFSRRGPLLIASAVVLVLIAFSAGYGYHRDELYFIACGSHLDWSYVDQGPLTPAIAALMHAVAPGSLVLLRLPSALMSGGTVFVAGVISAELGGSRRAQLMASACMAVASITLIVGHLLSTTTFDILAWSVVTWLFARYLRTNNGRLLLVAGLAAGIGLLNKPLIALLLAALGFGVLLVGPRRIVHSRWLWAGLVVAGVLWLPWLLWQSAHGWPQFAISSGIAAGASASSQPRWAFLPFQFLLVSPLLCPVWIAGLVALLRRPQLRPFRVFAVAWMTLLVFYIASGGKPYYLAGMFPVLLGAGAVEADGWLSRGERKERLRLFWAAVALSGMVSVTLALPVLPASDAGPVVALNPDAGETIGWPEFTHAVAAAYHSTGEQAVIVTRNYGEAAALALFGGSEGLPTAYSGHNNYWEWGPPPDSSRPVIAVGFGPTSIQVFSSCREIGRVSNSANLSNEEEGVPIDLCQGPGPSWRSIWPQMRHYN